MEKLLRFDGAAEWDFAIEDWLNQQPAELGEVARQWFTQFRDCGDDILELMHDGLATACMEDVPFGYVGVFTAHVNVGFFYGAELPDPAGLLEGKGKRVRHVKLRPGTELNFAALSALIDASYRDVKARL
jgi:hypothetical protein